MKIQETIIFNEVEYRLMGQGKYYLSQSKTNKGRKSVKGLHVAIWEFYNKNIVKKGYIVHHKDGNTLNNDINNLQCLSYSQHAKLHKFGQSDKQKQHLETIRPLALEWHKSIEGIEWHKKNAEKFKNRIISKCLNCGKEIEFPVSAKRKYCSLECAKIRPGLKDFGKRIRPNRELNDK